MDQRISLITLGVTNVAQARTFYERGLGWTPTAVDDSVVSYQLPGIASALWNRAEMAAEIPCPLDRRFGGITSRSTSGPAAGLAGVAAVAVGLSITSARAFLAQRDAVPEATQAQLYFPTGQTAGWGHRT